MEIFNIRVYNLEESAVASGFAKVSKYPTASEFDAAVDLARKLGPESDHMKRLFRLASYGDGSGHKNALKGVQVCFNVTAPIKWWMQAQRYSHFDIVSSMSTQHRLKELIKTGTIRFSADTSMDVINRFFSFFYENEDATTAELSQSAPMGLELCAHISTNYLQLRTIWVQRHTHPLEEWKRFCEVIETLPYAEYLISNKQGGKQ